MYIELHIEEKYIKSYFKKFSVLNIWLNRVHNHHLPYPLSL